MSKYADMKTATIIKEWQTMQYKPDTSSNWVVKFHSIDV